MFSVPSVCSSAPGGVLETAALSSSFNLEKAGPGVAMPHLSRPLTLHCVQWLAECPGVSRRAAGRSPGVPHRLPAASHLEHVTRWLPSRAFLTSFSPRLRPFSAQEASTASPPPPGGFMAQLLPLNRLLSLDHTPVRALPVPLQMDRDLSRARAQHSNPDTPPGGHEGARE